ncbi:PAS domain S-box protein [Thermodesulfobacteriota bacterium]
MKNEDRTREELIRELDALRARVANLESSDESPAGGDTASPIADGRLEAILNAVTESAFVLDLNANILATNKPAAESLGKTVDQLLGKPVVELMPPQLAGEVKARLDEVIRSGRQALFQAELAGGTLKNRLVPVLEPSGNSVSQVVLAQNTADHVQREETLRQQKQIIDGMQEGAILTDLSGVITGWNKGAERLFGYTNEEVMGKHLSFICPEEEKDLSWDHLMAPLMERGSHELEVRFKRKSHTDLFAHLSLSMLQDSGGEPVGIVAYSTDIGERKRAQDSLRASVNSFRTAVGCMKAARSISNESQLAREVCRIIAETQGYGLAWVGYLEHDDAKGISPVGQWGYEDGYLDNLTISWADCKAGRGPTSRCIRTQKVAHVPNFVEDPSYPVWRAEAANQDYGSCVAVPLTWREQVFGSLSIVASEPNTFDKDKTALLEELANLLAFEIQALRIRDEKERAERALVEGELQYQLLAESMTDGMAIVDESLRIAKVNENIVKMTGYSKDELIGLHATELLDDSDKEVFAGHYTRRKEGDSSRYEIRLSTRDGGRIPVMVSGMPILNNQGDFAGSLAILTDISYLKRSEESARRLGQRLERRVEERTTELANAIKLLRKQISERTRSEDELRRTKDTVEALLNATSEVALLLDTEGVCIALNRAAANDLGKPIRQILGTVPFKLFDEEIGRSRRGYFDQAVRERRPIRFEDERLGKTFDNNFYPVVGKDGRVRGVALFARNMTEQKLAEQRQKQLLDEIRHFTYIVSHDLRAPLVNLRGFDKELTIGLGTVQQAVTEAIESLSEERKSEIVHVMQEDIPEAVSFIESAVSRMDRLTTSILNLSRMGRRELSLEEIDMNALVEESLRSFAPQIDQLDMGVELSPLPTILADRTSMEQIIGNLLGNAIKYLKPGRTGLVKISADQGVDVTTFQISDNGIGVDKSDLETIFDVFKRSGDQQVPGEGMGLAYVRTLIRRHAGRIWCDSVPGEGSTFSFTISNRLPGKANA